MLLLRILCVFAVLGSSVGLVGEAVMGLLQSAKVAGTPALMASACLLDMVPGLPTQPATLAIGATLGFQKGLATVAGAQTAACFLSLTLARKLGNEGQPLGDFLESIKESGAAPLVDAVAQKVDGSDEGDWKTPFTAIYVLRNSPVVPFTLGNYLIGACTRAPIPPILLATFLGCLPANAVYVAAGAGLGAIADGSSTSFSPAQQAIAALGVLATVAVTITAADAVKQASEDVQDEEAMN